MRVSRVAVRGNLPPGQARHVVYSLRGDADDNEGVCWRTGASQSPVWQQGVHGLSQFGGLADILVVNSIVIERQPGVTLCLQGGKTSEQTVLGVCILCQASNRFRLPEFAHGKVSRDVGEERPLFSFQNTQKYILAINAHCNSTPPPLFGSQYKLHRHVDSCRSRLATGMARASST